MNQEQLEHVALLAEVDHLTDQLQRWIDECPPWQPARHSRLLIKRLLERVETLRFRLESPLVVATFGGTGTGKSSLVNALIGQEVSASGRQRPTTTTPILLVHPDMEPEALGLPLDDFEIKVVDSPVLRDIVVIDCPDPDSSDDAATGSNLAIVRSLLPHCDVLIYTSTQQKYKNARVVDELSDISAGCRLVFVQTHADLDSDVRDDWKQFLSPHYDVPDMFFVDSRAAYRQQQDGQTPAGEFGRLLELLSHQLGASRRIEIRRANLIDLLQEALQNCRQDYDAQLPQVDGLLETLEQQRNQIRDSLTTQLRDELLLNRTLWERRLLGSVTDMWGFSPFSSVLKFYNGLGSLIASFTFFRARTSAQMALIGAVQGARWVQSKTQQQEAESNLERLSTFGISDQQLQESRIAIGGHLRSSQIDYEMSADRSDLTDLRKRAANLEDEFLGGASRVIDDLIEKLAAANSHWVTRIRYDLLFMAYIAFLLGRVGYNFFWSSFLAPMFGQLPKPQPLLTVDFYIPALLFLAIWSLMLVTAFTWRLRRGLTKRVREFAESLADSRLMHGLFPRLEESCHEVHRDSQRLSELLQSTTRFRKDLADPTAGFLGRRQG